ncbi:MAG: T9SS type A sorting domain-containing protein, partial [Candidatus Cloacimonetes bacterium]|nr:T9SS type A sorting domain-containing protein [Candidatus Cloacimonadota bacterium]
GIKNLNNNYIQLRRTQIIRLAQGWNHISFNIENDTDPATAFGLQRLLNPGMLNTRYISNDGIYIGGPNPIPVVKHVSGGVYDENTSLGGLSLEQDKSYYVQNIGANTYYYKWTETIPPVTPFVLWDNYWNQMGYTAGKPVYTRSGLEYEADDIEKIESTTQVHYTEDDPLGSSTLNYVNHGNGYWVKKSTNDSTVVEIKYKHNNFVSRFSGKPFIGVNPVGSELEGTIDNDYAGYPMPERTGDVTTVPNPVYGAVLSETNGDRPQIGSTYKILRTEFRAGGWAEPYGFTFDSGTPAKIIYDDTTWGTHSDMGISLPIPTNNWLNYGAIVGLPGEIFTAILQDLIPSEDAEIRNINGPKLVKFTYPIGTTTIDIGSNKDSINGYDGIHFFTESVFLTKLRTFGADNLNEAGWEVFLNTLTANELPGPTVTTASDSVVYAVAYKGALSSLEDIELAVYRLSFKEANARTSDPGRLTSAGLWVEDFTYTPPSGTPEAFGSGRYFLGVVEEEHNRIVISVPERTSLDLTDSRLYFSFEGRGAYVELGTTPSTPLTSALWVSGRTLDELVDYNDKPFLKPYKFWISDDSASPGIIDSSAPWYIYIVKLPDEFFPDLYDFMNPDRRPTPPAPARNRDPYGQIVTLPESHVLLARVVNAEGQNVNPNNIIAAFVGDELRARGQIQSYQAQSWVALNINSYGNEDITFKYWREGIPVSQMAGVFPADMNIPGGITRNFILTTTSVDEGDDIDPLYINELKHAYPNPFNPSTTIKFSLKADQHANITIYNIKGQKVKTLVNEKLEKGNHTIVWEGEDSKGKATATGVYFIRMQTPGYEKVQKVMQLK